MYYVPTNLAEPALPPKPPALSMVATPQDENGRQPLPRQNPRMEDGESHHTTYPHRDIGIRHPTYHANKYSEPN